MEQEGTLKKQREEGRKEQERKTKVTGQIQRFNSEFDSERTILNHVTV